MEVRVDRLDPITPSIPSLSPIKTSTDRQELRPPPVLVRGGRQIEGQERWGYAGFFPLIFVLPPPLVDYSLLTKGYRPELPVNYYWTLL